MLTNEGVWMARGSRDVTLPLSIVNRHGLIAGATGTGKTVTLKVLAESLSAAGVPVFVSDVKGDLAATCVPGEMSEGLQKRLERYGLPAVPFTGFPCAFWDVFGESGLPVRTTVSEMGQMLLSRLLGLTPVQSGVMDVVFRIADDNGLLLLDLKDLRAMLAFVAQERKQFTVEYGNVSTQSVGAIQRALLRLESEGGELFFGEPAIRIGDFLRCDAQGRGMVNILDCRRLVSSPLLYASFMLYMLSELYEVMPERGDLEKPELVFFFDEAHLLFDSAPKALLDKIEQVVKLIRSKGVGVFFITQNPQDIPDSVLAQLGSRIQHALRAYTPAEQKAVRAAAKAFRENPAFDTLEVLTQLGVGEALISVLDADGVPEPVERAYILPPQSAMGTLEEYERTARVQADPLLAQYRDAVDRESAYELLTSRAESAQEPQQKEEPSVFRQEMTRIGKRVLTSATSSMGNQLGRSVGKAVTGVFGGTSTQSSRKKSSNSLSKTAERTFNTAMGTFGREVAKSLTRGLFGSLKF